MTFYQQKYFKPYRKIAQQLYPSHQKHYNNSKVSSAWQDSPIRNYELTKAPSFERSKNTHVRPQAVESQPIWEHLYNKGRKSQQTMLELHNNNKNKIDIQCTFQPIIKTNRRYLATSSSSFLQRANVWHQNKIEKMVKQKQQQVSRDLKECTFSPQINQKRRPKQSELNKSNNKLKKQQIVNRQMYRNINPYYSPIKQSKKQRIQNISPSPLKKKNVAEISLAKKMIHTELRRMVI